MQLSKKINELKLSRYFSLLISLLSSVFQFFMQIAHEKEVENYNFPLLLFIGKPEKAS